ncbi:MAG: dihydrodipicolinate synthase family protein [Planctomycetales bacterium]|nr:dihydrodipicolinate synthase family protein [Planctomycetales bacterium]
MNHLLIRDRLLHGLVIPAHPLALTADRKLDYARQRALTRYYLDSGVGGVAIGVHTTQFAIRDPKHDLLANVLGLAIETVRDWRAKAVSLVHAKPIMVAGICGQTDQALREAKLASQLGYDVGLLSLAALREHNEQQLIRHCAEVAEVIPLFGFYLQPAVGGRRLSFDFWRQFADINGVLAIKIAPFNRYQTLDVVRAVGCSSRWQEIAIYTGNDDSIVSDLVTSYQFEVEGELRTLRFTGGLLGHWACWTKTAVELHARCRALVTGELTIDSQRWLETHILSHQVTDMNAAIFDAANQFCGCIAGIHEVLRRQGLLEGNWCLDPNERMSPGQSDEITRVIESYPHLTDDEFVSENLARWLGSS